MKVDENRILEAMEVMQVQIESLHNEVKTQKLEKSNNSKPSYHLGRLNRNLVLFVCLSPYFNSKYIPSFIIYKN